MIGVGAVGEYFIQNSVISTNQVEGRCNGPAHVDVNIKLESRCARTCKSRVDSGAVSQIRVESQANLKVC